MGQVVRSMNVLHTANVEDTNLTVSERASPVSSDLPDSPDSMDDTCSIKSTESLTDYSLPLYQTANRVRMDPLHKDDDVQTGPLLKRPWSEYSLLRVSGVLHSLQARKPSLPSVTDTNATTMINTTRVTAIPWLAQATLDKHNEEKVDNNDDDDDNDNEGMTDSGTYYDAMQELVTMMENHDISNDDDDKDVKCQDSQTASTLSSFQNNADIPPNNSNFAVAVLPPPPPPSPSTSTSTSTSTSPSPSPSPPLPPSSSSLASDKTSTCRTTSIIPAEFQFSFTNRQPPLRLDNYACPRQQNDTMSHTNELWSKVPTSPSTQQRKILPLPKPRWARMRSQQLQNSLSSSESSSSTSSLSLAPESLSTSALALPSSSSASTAPTSVSFTPTIIPTRANAASMAFHFSTTCPQPSSPKAKTLPNSSFPSLSSALSSAKLSTPLAPASSSFTFRPPSVANFHKVQEFNGGQIFTALSITLAHSGDYHSKEEDDFYDHTKKAKRSAGSSTTTKGKHAPETMTTTTSVPMNILTASLPVTSDGDNMHFPPSSTSCTSRSIQSSDISMSPSIVQKPRRPSSRSAKPTPDASVSSRLPPTLSNTPLKEKDKQVKVEATSATSQEKRTKNKKKKKKRTASDSKSGVPNESRDRNKQPSNGPSSDKSRSSSTSTCSTSMALTRRKGNSQTSNNSNINQSSSSNNHSNINNGHGNNGFYDTQQRPHNNDTNSLGIISSLDSNEWICLFCQYEIFKNGWMAAKRKQRQQVRKRINRQKQSKSVSVS